MRIQNNITAMNTHRMYTINNDNVAKSAEKLSSGYRINRAGDDAAGLAISEKMRSQIRGLNMATKNSQDAISLVQTAEGALQETHAMLQRMNELAVQAATGTNEDLDRTALAKEFEQLKREINDVAEQTNFNNMKILDGSLSYTGYVRSAATAGVNATVETGAKVSDPAITVDTVNAEGYTAGAAPEKTFDLSAALNTFKGPDGSTTGEKLGHTLQLVVGGKAYDFELSDGSTKVTDKDTQKLEELFAGAKATVDIDGEKVTFTMDGTTKGKLSSTSNVNFDWADAKLQLVSYDLDDPSKTVAKELTQKASTKEVNGVAPADKSAANNATQTITLDQSKMNDGDSITIGDKTYTFYSGEVKRDASGAQVKTAATGSNSIYGDDALQYVAKDEEGNTIESTLTNSTSKNVVIVYDGSDSESAAKLLNAAIGGTTAVTTAPSGVAAGGAGTAGLDANSNDNTTKAGKVDISSSQAGNTVTITATITPETSSNAGANSGAQRDYENTVKLAEAANKAIETKFNSGGSKDSMKTTVEFDIAKMKDGDTFSFKVGSETVEVTYGGESRKDFMEKVVNEAFKGIDGATVKGNAVIIEDKKVDITLSKDATAEAPDTYKTNAIRIQVGALENEQLAVSIDSMNTAGLGLDGAFLTKAGNSTDDNIDLAGAAITATRNAINKVSDQRATLGAMQNRLDHKIANLKVSSENLSAAESRIRDVDMAQEMTNFTKNNILSQAATAMLAQANSLPQNVLSLLG